MPDIDRLLATGSGVLTTRSATAAGITDDDLRRATEGGRLHRVRRGIFVEHGAWQSATPWVRYRFLVRGVLLARPGWGASHHAAIVLHGLPMHGVDLALVDVAAEVRTSKRRVGTHVHRLETDLVEATGLPAVPVAHACAVLAAASGVESGVVSMDGALHAKACSAEELGAAVGALGERRGIARAREALLLADGAAESPGESRTRVLLSGLEVPVRSQVDLYDADGHIGRVDLLVGDRVVVEFDGMVKYEGADGREALAREKRREERLRDAGYRVVRVVWSELRRPDAVLARVRAALAAASGDASLLPPREPTG